jgi:sodium pump decarboxylase gamma subunit
MLTIFLVLSVLWGAIELLHLALGREKKAKPAKSAPVTPVAEDAPAPAAEPAPAAPVADDGAIVAAITAAISAQLESEGYTGGFRVVSFKRATASSKRRV